MEVYRYELQFEDYVFFATTERGKVFETGWFIHNYALTYALGLAMSSYRHAAQKPDYKNQLEPLNQAGLYITPAQMQNVTRYCINQFNTIDETFNLKREQSVGYPAWGFAKMFRPIARKDRYNATGYIICDRSLAESLKQLRNIYQTETINLFNTQYLRLGKFMAKVKMSLTLAESVKEIIGTKSISGMFNWNDLEIKPQLFNLMASALPTRLIESAKYIQPHNLFEVKFGGCIDPVYLPNNMSYLRSD